MPTTLTDYKQQQQQPQQQQQQQWGKKAGRQAVMQKAGMYLEI